MYFMDRFISLHQKWLFPVMASPFIEALPGSISASLRVVVGVNTSVADENLL